MSREPLVSTRFEEQTNTASAAAGLLLVLCFTPYLLGDAFAHSDGLTRLGALIFVATAIVLHLASLLYHALPPGGAKHVAHLVDHSGIFLLIAGTYSPFLLGPLREHGGWLLFSIEWIFAVAGIAFKLLGGMKYRRLSNAIYITMGWLGVFLIPATMDYLGLAIGLWILAGGVAYTFGVVFYAAKHRRHTHFIWHLFVIAGTACHAWAVLLMLRQEAPLLPLP